MYAKWYLSCGGFLVVPEDDDGRRSVESESENTIVVFSGFPFGFGLMMMMMLMRVYFTFLFFCSYLQIKEDISYYIAICN